MPYFLSSEGTKHIYYEIIPPKQGKPKAVIQVVHGMCEYFGRYKEFADFMAENGYAVAGDDHLGHGRTAEKEEDKGFFAEHNGWRFLVRDEKRMTEIIKREYPHTPIILFGHSMGSFIARLYTSWYPESIAAAVYMGTGSGVPQGAAGTAVKLLENAAGTKTPLNSSQVMFYHFLTRRVPDKKGELDWITRDREKIDFYRQDPLGNFAFTAGNGLGLFPAQKAARTFDKRRGGSHRRLRQGRKKGISPPKKSGNGKRVYPSLRGRPPRAYQ